MAANATSCKPEPRGDPAAPVWRLGAAKVALVALRAAAVLAFALILDEAAFAAFSYWGLTVLPFLTTVVGSGLMLGFWANPARGDVAPAEAARALLTVLPVWLAGTFALLLAWRASFADPPPLAFMAFVGLSGIAHVVAQSHAGLLIGLRRWRWAALAMLWPHALLLAALAICRLVALPQETLWPALSAVLAAGLACHLPPLLRAGGWSLRPSLPPAMLRFGLIVWVGGIASMLAQRFSAFVAGYTLSPAEITNIALVLYAIEVIALIPGTRAQVLVRPDRPSGAAQIIAMRRAVGRFLPLGIGVLLLGALAWGWLFRAGDPALFWLALAWLPAVVMMVSAKVMGYGLIALKREYAGVRATIVSGIVSVALGGFAVIAFAQTGVIAMAWLTAAITFVLVGLALARAAGIGFIAAMVPWPFGGERPPSAA